jgi:TRAP transporter 4TM/12TM fusion protein
MLRGTIPIILGALMALFQLYTGGGTPLAAQTQRGIHLGFGLVMIFLIFPVFKKKTQKPPLWADFIDLGLSILSIISIYYFVASLESLVYRVGDPNTADIAISLIGTLLLLEACRRTLGMALPIIATLSLAFALAGPYLPGALHHRGTGFDWLITHTFMSTEGIFGVPIGVSATLVYLFILFAAALEVTGGAKFFLDMSFAVFGKYRGGPAKIAVVASGCMGTISGSAAANVAGTGSITIPLMKSLGYKPATAGAIEAVASSGGLLMPPVMGAAAFIMAEILGVPYLKIVLAAVIPALLYYAAVFAAVDFQAALLGMKGLSRNELPPIKPVLKEGVRFIIPLLVLIYFIAVEFSTAQRAAFWGTISILVLFVFKSIQTRKSLRGINDSVKGIGAIFDAGSRQALPIVAACGVAGIVIGVISLTGFGFVMSGLMIELGGQNLLLMLFITAGASLILGMGLPVTACYIILAVLAAPALVKLGVHPLAAHMFVFYFGILSGITPPVAIAAYVGAGIAKAEPLQVAIEACKIGTVAFILPFMFVYNPVMLLVSASPWLILQASITGLLGSVAMAAGTQGYFLRKTSIIERVFLVGGACFLIIPEPITDIIGFIIIAVIAGRHYLDVRKLKLEAREGGQSGRTISGN